MGTDIVELKNGNLFTTTTVIADGVGVSHASVMRLISSHSSRPLFKNIRFEIGKLSTAGRPFKYHYLTEIQAYFLVTLMRNSEVVVQFKSDMTIQFFNMRNTLQAQLLNQSNAQWLQQRAEGVITRRLETDVIKTFIQYAKDQGGTPSGCDRYYANISRMENKHLFIVEGKYPNLRDVLGTRELAVVQQADEIVAKSLTDGMDDNLSYKAIYILAKERVGLFAKIRGVSPIEALRSKSVLALDLPPDEDLI